MPRNVNSIPASFFHDSTVPHWEFVHMYWPAPVGDLRWTNIDWADVESHDLGDEGTQAWDAMKVFTIGQIETGDQGPLSITDVTFGNADNSFSDIMKQYAYGTQGIKIDIWSVAYAPNPNPLGFPPYLPIDRMKVFTGQLDRAEVGDDVRVSLLALRVPLTIKYPRRRYSLAYGYKWIPPPNFKMKFGSSGTVTLPTPKAPATTTTPPPPFVPPPRDTTPVARVPPVLPAGGGRGTRIVPRGGRDTHKVPR